MLIENRAKYAQLEYQIIDLAKIDGQHQVFSQRISPTPSQYQAQIIA